MNTATTEVEHLYVHVPFCAAKCNYCAFYSESGNAAKMGDYVDAVVAELAAYCHDDAPHLDPLPVNGARRQLAPTTIFFGGGTPSLLPAPLMRRVLEAVGNLCSRGVSRGPTEAHASATDAPLEWTVECNPSTVSTEKANLFREFGVNRISMGVQSLDDDLLETLGRVHSVKAAVASYEKLRVAGFDNINLDLMFGLPGQTLEHWRNTLERAVSLQPEHLSTYCLIFEEDTHFWSLLLKGLVKPDEELELAMYELGVETLTAAGYRQYEISNFAKPGRECAHNIAYWEGKDYLGLGPSACSTIGSRRWQNVADIDGYVEAVSGQRSADSEVGRDRRARRSAISFEEVLTPELRAAERAAFGMRMNAGVPADLVRGRWDKQIAELLSTELVQWRHGRLAPTKRGLLFADEVAAEFV